VLIQYSTQTAWKRAKTNNDFSTQLNNYSSSKIYFQQNEDEKAVVALNKAYAISQKGNSAMSKNSFIATTSILQIHNKVFERIVLYEH
jgi:hypothetical protein